MVLEVRDDGILEIQKRIERVAKKNDTRISIATQHTTNASLVAEDTVVIMVQTKIPNT